MGDAAQRGQGVGIGVRGIQRELRSFRKRLVMARPRLCLQGWHPGSVGYVRRQADVGAEGHSHLPHDSHGHCSCREFASSCARLRICPRGTKQDPPLPHPGHLFCDSQNWSQTAKGGTSHGACGPGWGTSVCQQAEGPLCPSVLTLGRQHKGHPLECTFGAGCLSAPLLCSTPSVKTDERCQCPEYLLSQLGKPSGGSRGESNWPPPFPCIPLNPSSSLNACIQSVFWPQPVPWLPPPVQLWLGNQLPPVLLAVTEVSSLTL